MRRVAPSVMAREQLQQLLARGVDRETNIVSALVETVTQLVAQQLLEGEQQDFLGGRGRYDRRGEDQAGSRNASSTSRVDKPRAYISLTSASNTSLLPSKNPINEDRNGSAAPRTCGTATSTNPSAVRSRPRS